MTTPNPNDLTQTSYHFENIPQELKDRNQWVLWKHRCIKNRWVKIPYQIDGEEADHGDPTTWTTYEAVETVFQTGRFHGIGYVFSKDDPYTGIDLDNKEQNPNLKSIHRTIVERLNTYCEKSPSGTGVHLICRGELADDYQQRSDANGIEMYQETRFFTMTGHLMRITERHATIEERRGVLKAIQREFMKSKRKPKTKVAYLPTNHQAADVQQIDDHHLWNIMFNSPKVGREIQALYNGDTSMFPKDDKKDDYSAADQSLCNRLAFYTGNDAQRMDRMFRQTKLMRDKWDEIHGATTYGAGTIEKAIAGTTQWYTPPRQQNTPQAQQPPQREQNNYSTGVGFDGPPEMPNSKPKTKPFPVEALPKNIQAYCTQVADAFGLPVEFIGCNLLVACSIAIGNQRRVLISEGTKHIEKAILWLVIIARRSSGKSPAMDEALMPVNKQQARLISQYEAEMIDYQDELAQWEANTKKDKKAGRTPAPKPKPPKKKSITTNDVTIEALARMLDGNTHGLLASFDEFISFYRSLNSYRGGIGGDKEKYSSIWNGKALKVDRADETKDRYIPDTFVSIVGNMTPEGVRLISEGTNIDDGFTDRFLFSYPQDVPMMEWNPDDTDKISQTARDDYHYLIQKLFNLGDDITIPLSREARHIGADYYNNTLIPEAGDDEDKRGAYGKLRTYMSRLALIIHVVESLGANEADPTISGDTMKKAIEIIEYFKDQSNLVYNKFEETQFTKDVNRARAFIQRKVGAGETTLKFRDIQRGMNMRREEAEPIIRELEESNWLLEIERKQTRGSTSITYLINPQVGAGGTK